MTDVLYPSSGLYPESTLYPDDVFNDGFNLSAGSIAKGALQTLETWLVHFIASQERLDGLAPHTLTQPRSYVLAADLDAVRPDDAFPRVVVLSPGLAGDPSEGPMGSYYRAPFALAAGIFLRGESRDAVRDQLTVYTAAIRRCLIIKGIDGIDADLVWTDERYDTAPGKDARTLGGGEVAFVVYASRVVEDEDPYPNGPVPDPYQDPGSGPVVLSTEVELEAEELGPAV